MPTENERRIVQSHLLDYADENNFRVLAARDYGSRSRGLESESSDYDVFFVFAEPPAEYALGSDTETYTKSVQDDELGEIELHGWSMQRFVGNDGLVGSNPTAIEFTLSQEEYAGPDRALGDAADAFEQMCEHARENFKPYALINHYRSMAASNYGKYIEGDYKIADDASYQDLLTYGNPPWAAISEDGANHLEIDDSATEIGTDEIDLVGRIDWELSCGSIDIDRALDAGLVEPTTQDPTVKRHLAVVQSLLRARYVEETHEPPEPLHFEDFLRSIAGSDWLPEIVYARAGDLCVKKVHDEGEDEVEPEQLHEWFEDELSRNVEPQDHVQRQPDRAVIKGNARQIYNTLEWPGT